MPAAGLSVLLALGCLSLWLSAGSARAFTAEQLLDLQPGALRQYDAESQLDADVLPEERKIEELARYLELEEQRLRQSNSKGKDARQFSYNFPKTPPSGFALRPADPGYYAASLTDADSGEMQAGSDITLRQNSPLLQLDEGQLQPSEQLQLQPQVESQAQKVQEQMPQQEAQPPPPPQAEQEKDEAGRWSDYRMTASESALPSVPQQQQDVRTRPVAPTDDGSDLYFIAIVAGCSAAAIVGIIAVGISWYRLQKNAKAAADVEYPAYGVTGPNKETSPTGDRRLAQSAQMYHYQHQKQQIIAMESRTGANERPGSVSEAESDEEGEEGDYTVYECPGLAPTGEMEVKNPLFQDEPTPATPAPKVATAAPEQTDQPPPPPPPPQP